MTWPTECREQVQTQAKNVLQDWYSLQGVQKNTKGMYLSWRYIWQQILCKPKLTTAHYCYFLNPKFLSVSKLIFMTVTCWHLVGSVSCPCVSWGWLAHKWVFVWSQSRIRVTQIKQSAACVWIISISQLNPIQFACLCYTNPCLRLTNWPN